MSTGEDLIDDLAPLEVMETGRVMVLVVADLRPLSDEEAIAFLGGATDRPAAGDPGTAGIVVAS